MTAPNVLATPPHLQVQKLEGYTMAAVDAAAGKWQPLHNIGLSVMNPANLAREKSSLRAWALGSAGKTTFKAWCQFLFVVQGFGHCFKKEKLLARALFLPPKEIPRFQ
eukprot:scaffold22577_cov122-Cylindrotheca_fusiformis.AAC.34